ncbi:MAG: hypothetical protein KC766_06215 [Myxococcales bacterium]|nr:hypothetical protein [Myxococcales bacterium]
MTLQPQTSPTHAATIQCQRCGAAYRPPALTPHVDCPFCRHRQALEPERLAVLRGYERQVGEDIAAAEKHAQHQATYEKWYGKPEERKNHTAEFFIVAAVCALVAGLVGGVLVAADVVQPMLLPTIVIMGGFLSATAVTYGRMFLQMFRKVDVKRGQLTDVVVACPTCGAPGRLTPGDAIDTCMHCHAALVPEQGAMQQGLDAAARARRRAAIHHYRTEIETHASLYGGGSGRHIAFVVLVPFALMFTVPSIGITFEQLTSGKPLRVAPLLLMFAVCGTLWGIIAMLLWLRWSRRQAIRRGLAPLQQQFQGRLGHGTRALADWLLAHWAGPFPLQRLYTGVNHHLLRGKAGGFEFLIDFHPAKAEHMVTRATLMIPAEIPGVSPMSVEHQATLAALGTQLPAGNSTVNQLALGLRHAGFDLRVSEAGLSASADEELMRALRKRPERLAEWSQVIARCVELVRALGGRPAS